MSWLSPRRVATAFLFICLLLATAFTFAQGTKMRPSVDPDQPAEQVEKDSPNAREVWFRRGRQAPKGQSTAELLHRAYKQKLQLRQKNRGPVNLSRSAASLSSAPADRSVAPAQPGTISSSSLVNPSWTPLGPAALNSDANKDGFQDYGWVTGRTSAVAVDQNDATGNTVLIGGAYGGVWRSTNAAAADPSSVEWTPLIDNQPTLAVGAIAVQPNAPDSSNRVILVGTGEPNDSGDSYYGLGILRSADNGSTWSLITTPANGGTFHGIGFTSIAFHPTNPNLVVAGTGITNGASLGAEVNIPQSRGLYYSTDAGQTWFRANVTDNGASVEMESAFSVVFNPAADNGVGAWYAAAQLHGFYKSSDGQNWTRLASQPGGTLLATTNCTSDITNASFNCPIYRGALAVRPGRNEMYAWYVSFNFSTGALTHRGFYKTSDGGATWSGALTTTGFASCGTNDACGSYQTDYNMYIGAVPHGTGTDLYVGGGNIFKCTVASGASNCNNSTWLNLTHAYSCSPLGQPAHVHPDQHGFDFALANPDIIYFGNDGGVYRTLTSTTGLTSGSCTTPNAFQNLSGTMGSMTEFVSFSQHPMDSTSFLGGTQDNGSPATSGGNLQWQEVNGGDGGFNEINQTTGMDSFVENTDVTIQRCRDGSPVNCKAADYPLVININPKFGTVNFPDHGDFYTPFILDPQNQNRIIVGTCRVWRGSADGIGFTASSFANALTARFVDVDGINRACTGGENYIVKSLAAGGPVHATGSQAVWAGTIDGVLWFTTTADSGDSSWQGWILSSAGYPVSSVALDPTDPTGGSAYATVMGFGGIHVWKLTGGADPNGPFFQDISGDLPDAPADSIAIDPVDPTIIYVGTDVGVFKTQNNGVNWFEYGPNLPNVPVTKLRTFNVGPVHELRASTYGRGVWKISLASSVPPDYHIKITNPSAGALPNATGVLQGSVIFDPGYSGTVTLSCGSGAPTTCSFNQSSFSSPGTFSLNVADSSVQTFNFNIHGDDGSVQHDTATTFDVFDFEIQSVSPATLTIPRGTNAEWTVTLKSLGAFNRTVDVGCGAVPSSVFCSAFIENTVRPGAPVDDKLFVQTQPSTAVANTPLNIRACWAGSCKTAPANLNIVLNPHFTLQMSPGIAHVVRGGTTTFTLTASPHDGYTSSNITLSCISPPASVSCQFDMNPISETGTAILTVSAGPTAPLSEQWFIVQGDDGAGDVTTAQEFLAIDDFTVAGTPASQTVTSGNSASYTANTTDLSSTIPITIGCTNLPAGASCLAVPPVVSAGSSSTVTVSTTSGTTLPSTATFHITGTSLGVTRSSANLSLKTTDFQVTSTTPSTSVNAGSNGTISVNVKALNGYAKPVALSCSSLPVNVTCTFSTNNFTPASTGTAVTVTLHTTAAVPFGIYNTISLDALGDAQTHSIPLVLTVKDFHLSLNPTTVTLPLPAAGQTTATPAMVTFFADQGFNSVVTPSCVAPPTGVTCAFNPTTVTPTLAGANTTLTLTQTSVAASATTPLTIKGAAGTTLNHTQSLTVTTGGHNFTQAVTPTTQNVTAGSSANYTVVYTPLGGMTEDIVVACGALPLGVTCTPVPPVVTPGVTPGNQSIVALTTTFGTTPGANATVAISGVSAALNNLTRSTNVTLSVKDFTVTANTATIATNVGSNITDTILVKGLNGFTGVVALTCVIEGTPTGTACNLSNANPAASAAGTSVTATITSNAGTTPQGTYTVDVTGTNSGQQKIASFTVNIKDFSLGLGVNEITIPQPPPGQSSSLTVPITLTALNGFNSSASLSCSGQPAGVTCAFTPASGIPTALGLASTLKVTSTSAVTANTYHLQIKATAGTLIRTQPLDVTDFGPNFTETVTPITQNVTAGASAAYTVTFAPLGGMNQAILVGCGVLPAGVTCTPVPAVVTPGTTPGNQSIVTLQTTFAVTPGANAMVAISGVSSGIGVTRSTNVTLAVKDFTVTANTGTVATNVGTNITDTILVKGLNGFTGSVPLTCTIDTAPAGMGCALSNANPAASAAGSSVTATISSNMATTPHGVYTVHVAGTVSGQVKTATFAVTVKDFTLALDAPAFTIPQPPSGQSNSASTGVTITPLTGFGSTITFSCSGLPAGMTCSFATPGLVAVNATSAVVHGTYPITVKATAGTLVRQTNIDVTAFGPNFIQAVTPATQNVNAGSAAQYTVIYTPLGGMTDDITVGCGALLPAGVTCTPLPATANPGNGYQSVVTLQTTFGTTPAANATVFISGVSAAQNNLTRSNNVTLAVRDFSVIRNTPIVTTNVGTNITDTVVVKALNGFTGNVALACAIEGAPAGATCTLSNLNPAATSNGTSVTATITSTAATTPPGSYLIDVTGTTLAGSHGRQFTVNIKDFSLDIQPETQSITATGATVFADYTLTATALNGFNSSATLTCVTPLPTGVTCGFGASHSSSMSVVPTGAGLVIPFRITVSGSTAPHTHELTIRGSSGTLIRTDGAELQLQ